ncbi:MAG: 16S rRNA (cytosine(1402)-N(4))-methyltransferase RsmH [Bacteroidota bacterium]
MTYHIPVLAQTCLEGLALKEGGIYVDATFGGGGHSRLILEKLEDVRLIGFDQDPDVKKNIPDDPRFIFVGENFRYMKNFLKLYHSLPADGILADLGVSSWQIDKPERGFSTRFDGPLDMRMDIKNSLTASRVVNSYEKDQLTDIMKLYGELRNGAKVASEIIFHRRNAPIETTGDLIKILEKLAPRGKENKFYAQVFQALRIEVNNELDALQEFLRQTLEVLRPGGRLVVISYHSLEDRLVKNFMRSGNFTGEAERDFFGNVLSPIKPLGKLIIPDEDELERNPRARSAKLRIAELI